MGPFSGLIHLPDLNRPYTLSTQPYESSWSFFVLLYCIIGLWKFGVSALHKHKPSARHVAELEQTLTLFAQPSFPRRKLSRTFRSTTATCLVVALALAKKASRNTKGMAAFFVDIFSEIFYTVNNLMLNNFCWNFWTRCFALISECYNTIFKLLTSNEL